MLLATLTIILGFLGGLDIITLFLVFLGLYIAYRIISALIMRSRNDVQAQDYIKGRDQQTQLLSEILKELKKLNEKA